MLPATGLLIMGLDWLLFSNEAASFGLLIPFTSLVGFLAGSIGTYLLQTRHGLDSMPAAGFKALLAGILGRHSISARRHNGGRGHPSEFGPGRSPLAAA